MTEPASYRVQQAEALLNNDMLRDAFALLEAEALREILDASGPDADRVRREAAERIRVVREVPQILKIELAQARSEMPK